MNALLYRTLVDWFQELTPTAWKLYRGKRWKFHPPKLRHHIYDPRWQAHRAAGLILHIAREAKFIWQGAGGTLRGLQNRILLYQAYLEIKFIIFKFHLWILQIAKLVTPISQNLPCVTAHTTWRLRLPIWQSSASSMFIKKRAQKMNLLDEL